MMRPEFSDEDIGRFLDGEADVDLSKAVEDARAKDAEFASFLNEMNAAKNMFVAAHDDILSMAPPAPALPPRQAANTNRPIWMAGLSGVAAGIVMTIGVVTALWEAPKPPGWRAVVANYQSLYVTETLASVMETPEQSMEQLVKLSGVLGMDLTMLPEVQGLDYRRAQQLGFKGRPLAQLTFLTEDGGPVALCIVHTGQEDSDAILAETLDGLAAFSWVENGFGILLIGPTEDTTLPKAAETFRAALEA